MGIKGGIDSWLSPPGSCKERGIDKENQKSGAQVTQSLHTSLKIVTCTQLKASKRPTIPMPNQNPKLKVVKTENPFSWEIKSKDLGWGAIIVSIQKTSLDQIFRASFLSSDTIVPLTPVFMKFASEV